MGMMEANIRSIDIEPNVLMAERPLIVLVGPTAIGKSRIAIQVAKQLRTEILTADSTQVYRGMDIGTDKPSLTEQAQVSHRLINLVNPDEPFNAGEYRRFAVKEIERLYDNGCLPLVVGGTGLYVRVLVRGIWSGPPVDWAIRFQLEEESRQRGMEDLYRELSAVDPDSARQLHPNDRVKVLRALEVYRQMGVPRSEAHQQHRFQDCPFRLLFIGLSMNRQSLYERIEARVELELSKGLVEETQTLIDKGYSRDLTSMKSLGYRQMASYLAGECDYQEAVRRLKRDTRHFAKRQMTWFRKEPDIEWFELQDEDQSETVANRILARIEKFSVPLSKRDGLRSL